MNQPSDLDRMKALIAIVADGRCLSESQAEEGCEIIMSGNATPSQMGGFLMALRVRGETVEEITGAVRTMRAKALRIHAPEDAIDTVGTGGDAVGTFNISTATAFVVAGAGVPVAKHGNRALSSRSGAADVLTALGVNIDCDLSLVERSIAEAGVGFMMAPRHHSAMRHVAGTRVELGTRTLFNLLGPLSNPAGVRRQLVGTFARKWVEPMAETLGRLGSLRAWVAHSEDGLDEITTSAPTHIAELKDGRVRTFTLTPEDAGLPRVRQSDLKGGTAQDNAEAIRNLLDAGKGPFRDVVLLNAAAALVISERVSDLRAGVARAAEVIDSGRAKRALARMIEITNSPPPLAAPK